MFAVAQDLGCKGVFVFGDVTQLFTERKVDVGFGVAGGAGITIPIPGATKVAAFFDEPDVIKARLLQSSSGQQTAETATNNDDLGMIGVGFALGGLLNVRVINVIGIVTDHLDVLRIAIGTHSLIALQAIFLAQGVRIEGEFGRSLCVHGHGP